ncbi:hypothetical protein NC651_012672 [Populus alba x Populus x berolinensis]|nr:hypothetical protein NC651_012672 [Populus alba x Populus x berolinensis]
MASYKAPGKDGIQPLFFKQYWYVMGDDVWDLVRSAFVQYGSFDSDLSETLIVLIPKEERWPTTFKQFRLISLCIVIYKGHLGLPPVYSGRIQISLRELNDVLLFAKARTSHMQLMIKVVSDFCNASDLKVCSGIDGIVKNFIQGRSNDDRGIHRVNSDTISSPRRFGGLGTGDSRSAINALLEKDLKSQDLFKATAPPSSSITDVLLLKPSPISEMASCIKLGKGEVKIFGTTEHGILSTIVTDIQVWKLLITIVISPNQMQLSLMWMEALLGIMDELVLVVSSGMEMHGF